MLLAVMILSGIFNDIQTLYVNETALHKIYERNPREVPTEDLYSVCIDETVTTCEKIRPQEVKECKICGLFNDDGLHFTIIDGTDIEPPYLYPWMVALMKDERKICGGAILNENYILTAGHCISKFDELTNKFIRILKPKELKVGFLTKTDNELEKKEVEQILHHPKFDPVKMKYDIALLKLGEKITCDIYKNPICLPPEDFKPKDQKDIVFHVTGWGAISSVRLDQPSHKLQGALGVMVSFDKCKASLPPGQVGDTGYCIMGVENGRPCFGDSGGSLFYTHERKFATAGVASLHTCKQCSAKKPFVYSSVPKALKWIKKVIGSHQEKENKDF